MQERSLIIFLLLCMGFLSSVWAAEQNYYRYKDKDGHIAISSTLPPEVTKRGYEIISARGNVLEIVPPEKTPEEIAKEEAAEKQKKKDEEKAEQTKKDAEAQAKQDAVLLRSFSSADDVARSRDEKINSIKVLQEITQDNIKRLKVQLENMNANLANYQKQRQKVPDSLQKTIDETNRQITENETFLEQKEKEKKQIYTDYQGWIDRYKELEKKSVPQQD